MKNYLLVLLGRHPKVVTESLFSLGVKRNIPISDVFVVSTAGPKENAMSRLLAPQSGEYHKLCGEYPAQFKQTKFTEQSFAVAQAEGHPVLDISGSKQSQEYLDLIMGLVRDLTSFKNIALHGVVAGGRRTLSVYLAMAMQLYARQRDRLYHLAVNPWQAETNSDFFFPTRKSKPMSTYDGIVFDAKDVTVELVDVPFLRLRARVPPDTPAAANYGHVLKLVQRDLETATRSLPLRVDAERRSIWIDDTNIALEPVEFAVYWYFAEKSAARPPRISHDDYELYFEHPKADGLLAREASLRIRTFYESIIPRDSLRSRFMSAFIKERLPIDHLRPHFSNIKKKICGKFPNEDLNRLYLISAVGLKGDTCYGLRLDRQFIRLPTTRL